MLERGVYWLSDSVEILYGRDVYVGRILNCTYFIISVEMGP